MTTPDTSPIDLTAACISAAFAVEIEARDLSSIVADLIDQLDYQQKLSFLARLSAVAVRLSNAAAAITIAADRSKLSRRRDNPQGVPA